MLNNIMLIVTLALVSLMGLVAVLIIKAPGDWYNKWPPYNG